MKTQLGPPPPSSHWLGRWEVGLASTAAAASDRIRPLLHFLEGIAFACFTALFIWRLQTSHPLTWRIFPAWLVLSFALHRDTPKTLGWRADNLLRACRRAIPFFVLAIAGLCAFGLALGGGRRVPSHLFENRRFWGYCAFCLLQQVSLNSFLTNRLLTAFGAPVPAAVTSGMVFAALHWPNPFLVPLTFVAGSVMTWLFATERNILPLTLMQAILGALVWWAFPIVWHHGMRIGPGFYTFHN